MSDVNRIREMVDRAMALARHEEWAASTDLLRRAVEMDAENVESRYRLGWVLARQAAAAAPTLGDLAVGYGAQVLGFDGIARGKGSKFRKHKRLLQDAAHWLREAIARDQAHADAHYTLATCLRALGYREEAENMARKAAELYPRNTRYATLVDSFTSDGQPVRRQRFSTADSARLTWSDVVLAPRTKRELRQMQLMLETPDLAQSLGVEPPTGILLKGAPGTGKTTIARILANEARCAFLNVTPADINEMYVGESEKRVKELFARARSQAPSIVFIDEIDALLPSRQGGVAIHSDKVVNQFLQEMDGMTPNSRVFVVGATNRPDMLDPAVRRGGRLSREIEIPLPDRDGRLALFQLFTRTVALAEDVNLADLADRTDGYSGADIRATVNEAGLQALIRLADAGSAASPKELTAADFAEALQNMAEEE